MRINFQKVEVKGVRRWKENGKPRQETRTFMQTINPFNKNEDGSLKTYDQILAEVKAERDAWLAQPA